MDEKVLILGKNIIKLENKPKLLDGIHFYP